MGVMRGRAAWVAMWAAGVLLASAAAVAQPPQGRRPDELDALLARFAAMPGLSARFREEKRIGLLAAPLVSEGTLHFARPGKLVRHTERPDRATLLIEGRRLRMSAAGRRQEIDLSTQPVVRSFVDAFVQLLAGNGDALRRTFELELAMTGVGPIEGQWALKMKPRDRTMRRMIREIHVNGRGVVLTRIVVRETSGDESETTFSDVRPNRRFSQSETARIFRLR